MGSKPHSGNVLLFLAEFPFFLCLLNALSNNQNRLTYDEKQSNRGDGQDGKVIEYKQTKKKGDTCKSVLKLMYMKHCGWPPDRSTAVRAT